MRLFEMPEFDTFAQALPGVTLVDQWESRVAKVGGKVFMLLGHDENGGRIFFKCTEDSFEILTQIAGITQAPYFAKRQWVCVSIHADLPDADLRAYATRSHKLVAAGLTKKLRIELGIPLA